MDRPISSLFMHEPVLLAGRVPNRHMRVATVSTELGEWLWHEACPQSMVFSNRLGHEFEKYMFVRRGQAIVIFPVHFELPVAVLVVILVRVPAQFEHCVTDFPDDVVTPHKCTLVVTGFCLGVAFVRYRLAVGIKQEKFAFHTRSHAIAFRHCGFQLALQNNPG